MKTIRIFLASSSELKPDREAFEIALSRLNKCWTPEYYLRLELWEDFIDAMSPTRLQDEYNRVIEECDIFVMLAHNKVGRYTEEEFERAFSKFKGSNDLHIYTYFKIPSVTTDEQELKSLNNFRAKLDELGHYPTEYETADGLIYKFIRQLEKLKEKNLLKPGEEEIPAQWTKIILDDIDQPADLQQEKMFYEGKPTTWNVINQGTFKRDLFDKVIESVGRTQSFTLLTGAGGEGKSTLLKQLGIHFVSQGWTVLFTDQPGRGLADRLEGLNKRHRYLLLVDNATYYDQLSEFLSKVQMLHSTYNICVVIASRKNEWNAFLQVNRNNSELKRRFGGSTFELSSLSEREIKLLKELLVSKNMVEADQVDSFFRQSNRSFLLAVMLSVTHGKPLEMIIEDVLANISDYPDKNMAVHAIDALAVITFMEQHLSGQSGDSLCSRKLLQNALETNRLEFAKVLELLEGEAFVQQLKNTFITRNPIITRLYYQNIFNDAKYADAQEIASCILEQSVKLALEGSDTKTYYYILSELIYALYEVNPDEAIGWYRHITDCGLYAESYLRVLAGMFEQLDADDEDSVAQSREAFRLTNGKFEKSAHYLLWARFEQKVQNTGNYDQPYSARWLYRKAYELKKDSGSQIYKYWFELESTLSAPGSVTDENTPRWIMNQCLQNGVADSGTYIRWAEYETDCKNTGGYDTEYSARWILRLGMRQLDKTEKQRIASGSLALKLAEIELAGGNPGACDQRYTARWWFKEGAQTTKYWALYQKWAELELADGDPGNYDRLYSARWILKTGAEKTGYGNLYRSWAKLELKYGEIGSYEQPCSVRWILKRGIENTKYPPFYQELAEIEKNKGNMGGYDQPYTVLWLLKEGAGQSKYHGLYQKWAEIEQERGNTGDCDQLYSACWILKRGIETTKYHGLYQKWAEIEQERGNTGDCEHLYSACWILKRGIDATKYHGLYQKWAEIEQERGNTGDCDQLYSACWILKRGIDATKNAGLYQKWAEIEQERGNTGDCDQLYSACWILKDGIERTHERYLYLKLAEMEQAQGNLGSFTQPYSVRWLLKDGIERTKEWFLYQKLAEIEWQNGNLGSYEVPYSARWLLKEGISQTQYPELYRKWAEIEAAAGNLGDIDQLDSTRWILKEGIDLTKDARLYQYWAEIEAAAGNLGNIDQLYSTRWILKEGVDLAKDPGLYQYWAEIEAAAGNLGNIDQLYSARWILKRGIEATKYSGLYQYWAEIEAAAGNLGNIDQLYSARWILNEGIKQTNYSGIYLKWAEIEETNGNKGDYDQPDTAKWILKQGIMNTSKGHELYCRLAEMEWKSGNIGDYDRPYSVRWLLKTGFEKSKSLSLYILMASVEVSVQNFGTIHDPYTARWIYFQLSKSNNYSPINWCIVEYMLENPDDTPETFGYRSLMRRIVEKYDWPIRFKSYTFDTPAMFYDFLDQHIVRYGNIDQLIAGGELAEQEV